MTKWLAPFEPIIDAAGIGLYSWTLQDNTVRWSGHHYKIFGWPLGLQVTHAMFHERIHPGDVEAVDAAVAKAISDHTDYNMRFRICLPDGTVRHVHGSGRLLYDKDGQPTGIDGAVIDVTHATTVQGLKREREMELAIVAENLPDVITRYDTQLCCMFISSRIEELTGKLPEFFVGKTPTEFGIDVILAKRIEAVLEDVVRNKVAREFEFSLVDRRGAERFLITRAVPFFDDEGTVTAIFTIASDHTQREQTARQLRANGVQLEKADRRKNEYLATLAHELRGPLAPISSATQLIKLSAQRPVRERAREVIERQVAQLSDLVNDLMEVGRISAGKLEIDLGRISMQSVIEQAMEGTRPLLDAKQQPLTHMMPDAPIWLDGDALRLNQVFINLLTNASKYSPPGTAISVEATVDGSNVLIHVRDEGIGLTDAAMGDIFELFVQVHSSGVQAQGGLGIGLSLVKKLVELHEGQVSVSSDGPDKGSCFTVTLPMALSQTGAAQSIPLAEYAPSPLTVLVVDDNVDGATTLALLLETLGHTAVTAFNGYDAVALAAERPVDMAFVDLGLPDISGIQVALRIRGTPQGRKLPLVALTGLGRDDDKYMTQAAKFDEHIVKPLQMADLMRITESVASRRRTHSASVN